MKLYRIGVICFSIVFLGIGIALLARTAAAGGGAVGFILGGLFIALGVGRLTIERRRGS